MALILETETYSIIGACIKVHQALGSGFLESVYQEAIRLEFEKQQIPYSQQKRLSIIFDGNPLDKFFVADFVCYNSIILEIKAASFIHPDNSKQVINYLKATNFEVGLLINFGQSSLKWKRFINTPSAKSV
jgi:GxxExxY protein